MRTGALEGLRVLDLGQIWAGPLCVHMLGDMGAEVVRVETRGRAIMAGRPEFGPDDPPEHAASYYLRNRICLSADLSHEAGVELVRELARIVDGRGGELRSSHPSGAGARLRDPPPDQSVTDHALPPRRGPEWPLARPPDAGARRSPASTAVRA